MLLASGKDLGPATLFFGCRSRRQVFGFRPAENCIRSGSNRVVHYFLLVLQDYIYEDELLWHVEKGILTELSVAFSRDGPSKEYVQHKMAERVSIAEDSCGRTLYQFF